VDPVSPLRNALLKTDDRPCRLREAQFAAALPAPMRIGYAPYSPALSQPGDRRRFPFYASRRGLDFELADPACTYDIVVLTPRADLLTWSRNRPGRSKIVFDIVDSYLEIPRADPKAILRGPAKFLAGEARHPFFSYRRALEQIIERSHATVCATPEQALSAARLCRNVHAILDFQSDLIRRVKQDYTAGSPFHLVWEGLGNNVRWFSEIARPLKEVTHRHPLVLHLVTAIEYREFLQRFWRRQTARIAARYCDELRLYQWSAEMVSVIATACDLAVIPLPLNRPFERGKPENKLIMFWRMGLPTITSSTPAYARTMEEAGQCLDCETEQEWVSALLHLISDEDARARAGRAGRDFAEGRYSDEHLLEAWDTVFGSL
jgi:glycosyltransferase involved in cell wall biosynthesis